MKWEIRINGCKRTAFIESLLRIMGAEEVVRVADILFDEQTDYPTNTFHRDLRIPTARRFRIFHDWMYLTFQYDKGDDMGHILFYNRDRSTIEKLISELKLLEQKTELFEENGKKLEEEMEGLEILKIEPFQDVKN